MEQPQAVGIVERVGIVGIVGISLFTMGPAIQSCMGILVNIKAHDILGKFCIV